MKRTRWAVALTGAGMVAAAVTAGTAMASAPTPPPTGPQQTGPQQTGPQQTGPQQTGPQQTGPQQTGPQQTGGGSHQGDPQNGHKGDHKGDPKGHKGEHKGDPKGHKGEHKGDPKGGHKGPTVVLKSNDHEGSRGGDCHHGAWENGLTYTPAQDPQQTVTPRPAPAPKADPCAIKPLDLKTEWGAQGSVVVLQFPNSGCKKEDHGKAVLWTSQDGKKWSVAGIEDPQKNGNYSFHWKGSRGVYIRAEVTGYKGGHTCDSKPMYVH